MFSLNSVVINRKMRTCASILWMPRKNKRQQIAFNKHICCSNGILFNVLTTSCRAVRQMKAWLVIWRVVSAEIDGNVKFLWIGKRRIKPFRSFVKVELTIIKSNLNK